MGRPRLPHADFTEEQRFKIWNLAVLQRDDEMANGTASAVRFFGDHVLIRIHPSPCPS